MESTYFKLLSEFDILPPPAVFGLKDCDEGGAARFNKRAHVAIFVFISPALKKCFPIIKKEITDSVVYKCMFISEISIFRIN